MLFKRDNIEKYDFLIDISITTLRDSRSASNNILNIEPFISITANFI